MSVEKLFDHSPQYTPETAVARLDELAHAIEALHDVVSGTLYTNNDRTIANSALENAATMLRQVRTIIQKPGIPD